MAGILWEVVGGSDKGGILVREEADGQSGQYVERLSTGALIEGLDLVDGRLNYERITGSGPETGWVSLKVGEKPLVTKTDRSVPVRIWEVVGGGEKGGILVRKGVDITSDQEAERLATGATFRQLKRVGERLQYEKLTAAGPSTGWVSLRAGGKDLVAATGLVWPDEEAQSLDQTPACGPLPWHERQFTVLDVREKNEEKGFSYAGLPPWAARAAATQRLWREGQPYLPPPPEELPRLQGKKTLHEFYTSSPYIKYTSKKLKDVTKQSLPGIMYGLLFPHTRDQIEEYGPEWLTKAMHAAGTLPEDNSVKRVLRVKELDTSGLDCAGGAGKKAFIDVEYEKADPELHTELFAKYPYEYDFKPHQRYFLSGSMDNDGPEVAANIFAQHLFPMRTPKFYFADINRESTNYILINERIPYGERGEIVDGKVVGQREFGPFEVLPGCGKYQDFLLTDPITYYFAIFRMMGRLGGWDKQGRLDGFLGPAQIYNEAEYLSAWQPERKTALLREQTQSVTGTMVDKGIDFVTNVGKTLFQGDSLVNDMKRLTKMKAELVEMSPYFFDMSRNYQMNHTDYICAMHVNLQADNAFFWRDEYGDLDCGGLDWGSFGRSPFCSTMLGCVGGMEAEPLIENIEALLGFFAAEYQRCGGPKTDAKELITRFYLSFVINVYDCFQWLERDVYKETKQEEFAQMKSIRDPLFQGKWNTRCRCSTIYFNLRHYMLKGDIKNIYDKWAKGKGKRYLTVYA